MPSEVQSHRTLCDLFSFAALFGNAAWLCTFVARERGEEGEWDEWGRRGNVGPLFFSYALLPPIRPILPLLPVLALKRNGAMLRVEYFVLLHPNRKALLL